jgi:hypothetical protein
MKAYPMLSALRMPTLVALKFAKVILTCISVILALGFGLYTIVLMKDTSEYKGFIRNFMGKPRFIRHSQ